MRVVKLILTALVSIMSVLGMIGGAVAARYWLIVAVILSVTKLAGLTVMPWFAGITTVSAVGTGLWMLLLGSVFFLLSTVVLAVIAGVIDDI